MYKTDLIPREDYLSAIRPFIGVKLVKIIAGVRRCGKSYVLDMIGDELLSKGVCKENIIFRLYTSAEVSDGFSKKEMLTDLVKAIKPEEKSYLLLDEVQEVDGWEKVINTLFEQYNVDIYVTGSNSKLTSENISSYLSGRYVIIPVYTLSYSEYLTFNGKNKPDKDDFKNYCKTGGFPLIVSSHLDFDRSYQIAKAVYDSIIVKDILKNHPIKDIEKFNRITRFVVDNSGKTVSATSISKYLKSQQRAISVQSVYSYLEWLLEAFILYKCNRINLKGKEILKTLEKYYLADISLRYAISGYNIDMDDFVLENIVYLELLRRGYNVYVGKLDDKEIDFVATKQDKELHIQVTVKIPNDSNRETQNLLDIKDCYHKFVVTGDKTQAGCYRGIDIIYIEDFLLSKYWG